MSYLYYIFGLLFLQLGAIFGIFLIGILQTMNLGPLEYPEYVQEISSWQTAKDHWNSYPRLYRWFAGSCQYLSIDSAVIVAMAGIPAVAYIPCMFNSPGLFEFSRMMLIPMLFMYVLVALGFYVFFINLSSYLLWLDIKRIKEFDWNRLRIVAWVSLKKSVRECIDPRT